MRARILILAAACAGAILTGACGSSTRQPAAAPASLIATPAPPAQIQPVAGTHKNVYRAGPFTLTLVAGVTKDPDGNQASQVLVENTSNDFTGFAQPTVQYFQGAEVLGESSATTESLTPGQKQTLWVPIIADLLSKNVSGQYLDAQLVSDWSGADRSQPGATLQLAH